MNTRKDKLETIEAMMKHWKSDVLLFAQEHMINIMNREDFVVEESIEYIKLLLVNMDDEQLEDAYMTMLAMNRLNIKMNIEDNN